MPYLAVLAAAFLVIAILLMGLFALPTALVLALIALVVVMARRARRTRVEP